MNYGLQLTLLPEELDVRSAKKEVLVEKKALECLLSPLLKNKRNFIATKNCKFKQSQRSYTKICFGLSSVKTHKGNLMCSS
jgi:hypothetical protein